MEGKDRPIVNTPARFAALIREFFVQTVEREVTGLTAMKTAGVVARNLRTGGRNLLIS